MIKTVVFDIGNVLTGFCWREFFLKFGFTEEVYERICRATVKSSAWCELDRGVMTDEEVLQAFIENDPGIERELRTVFHNMNGLLVRYDYAIPWIKELKDSNYQVLVLSNFARKAGKDCADALDFLAYVDGGILSYQEKVIKPEPAIYELLLNRYHLKAKECVFLDDTEKNLTAAARFGIHTIHFINQAQAIEELEKLGVEHGRHGRPCGK